jgi:hypothetical protein
VVDDVSHEGLRRLLLEEGVSFRRLKTWKVNNAPDFEAEKNRIPQLYAIADGTVEPGENDPTVVICLDDFPTQPSARSRTAVGAPRRARVVAAATATSNVQPSPRGAPRARRL